MGVSPLREEPSIAALKESEPELAGEVPFGEQVEIELLVKETEDLLAVDATSEGFVQLDFDTD